MLEPYSKEFKMFCDECFETHTEVCAVLGIVNDESFDKYIRRNLGVLEREFVKRGFATLH